MNSNSQSGVTLLQVIIGLTLVAVLFALISTFTQQRAAESTATQEESSAAEQSGLELMADQRADELTAPVTAPELQNDQENSAEMALNAEADLTTAPTDDTTPAVAVDPIDSPTPGTFTDYDPELLSDSGTNILFFHADWCPSCRGLENSITANLEAIPDGVTILKLDFDSETALKRQYGVVRQHTLVVVDGDGSEVRKLTGLTNTLEQVVNQL